MTVHIKEFGQYKHNYQEVKVVLMYTSDQIVTYRSEQLTAKLIQ